MILFATISAECRSSRLHISTVQQHEPAGPEPTVPEPARPESARPEPAWPEPVGADPNRAKSGSRSTCPELGAGPTWAEHWTDFGTDFGTELGTDFGTDFGTGRAPSEFGPSPAEQHSKRGDGKLPTAHGVQPPQPDAPTVEPTRHGGRRGGAGKTTPH